MFWMRITCICFDHQLYIETVKVTRFRVALRKLRVSSHRLEIEVGRWTRPNRTPIEQRKCRRCNTVEDEFHFLLECKSYNQIIKSRNILKNIIGVDQIW